MKTTAYYQFTINNRKHMCFRRFQWTPIMWLYQVMRIHKKITQTGYRCAIRGGLSVAPHVQPNLPHNKDKSLVDRKAVGPPDVVLFCDDVKIRWAFCAGTGESLTRLLKPFSALQITWLIRVRAVCVAARKLDRRNVNYLYKSIRNKSPRNEVTAQGILAKEGAGRYIVLSTFLEYFKLRYRDPFPHMS